MKGRRQEIGDRTKLAGGGGRRFEAMGNYTHGRALSGDGRDFRGTKSGGSTSPPVVRKIAAETCADAPRLRNLSLRTPSTERPMRSPIAASDTASRRIQCFKETMLAASPAAPAVLPTARLAEALAVFAVDLIEAVGMQDRRSVLEGLANRLDGRGRTPDGSEAAVMLGAVGGALMRLGC